MKSKSIIILIVLLIFVVTLCITINFEKKYKDYFSLPYLSNKEKKCADKIITHFDNKGKYRSKGEEICVINATFTSLKNLKSINKKIQKVLSNDTKTLCNNNNYTWYDKDNNITITGYDVKRDRILSHYYINYIEGKLTAYDCNIIDDYENVEYGYDKSYLPVGKKYKVTDKQYEYKHEDGEYYYVHSDCPHCLTIKNGRGTMTTLIQMLEGNYISMKTLIDSLDYSVSKNNTTKESYDDGILYKNKIFNLFICNTKKKDIYISEKIDYSKLKDVCK